MSSAPASSSPASPSSRQRLRARREELGRYLPLWPTELYDGSRAGRGRVLRLLARALREERKRARGGHWAYDLARHAALARLYRAELAHDGD